MQEPRLGFTAFFVLVGVLTLRSFMCEAVRDSFDPCLFFLIIRRPPTSTPFPYTTLFRSGIGEDRADRAGEAVRVAGGDEEGGGLADPRSEEHTSELQSPWNVVCRLRVDKSRPGRMIGDDRVAARSDREVRPGAGAR